MPASHCGDHHEIGGKSLFCFHFHLLRYLAGTQENTRSKTCSTYWNALAASTQVQWTVIDKRFNVPNLARPLMRTSAIDTARLQ